MTGFPRGALSVVVLILMLAVGFVAGWICRGMHAANGSVPTIALYDGWRLSCPPAARTDLPCAISNDLIDSKNRRQIAQLTIVPAKAGAVLVITAPYDVLLPAGLGLVIGNDKPRAYPYQFCNFAGCVVQIRFDDNLRDAMVKAQQGKLLFGSLDKKIVAVVFSLKGFADAEKALEAHQNKNSFLGISL
jgi:invasion protein IalB